MSNRAAAGRSEPLWSWLTPSLLLLGAMAVWGVLRYPELPDRVPEHIGPERVDAWTAKSVGAAFVPVFVYAGITVVLAGCAALSTHIRPLNEMPASASRRPGATNALTNRPASAASGRRTARALLIMNALCGAALLPLCWIQWRTPETAEVPAWLLPGTLELFLLGLVPMAVAWWQDAAEKKAARTA
ncbi:DUF1648 domain-containing protein [Streptomyces winkii]|uniref:DUF1648 domain-containing protein n=1 Tax=Streptomyces winkii TaxID=3051178 RepID=UPI0028D6DB38|nr:DUF1648 domain-containing protein [Streptomyces sp. DSM 40971]